MHCEIPEFFNETYQRARKEHKCCECNLPIKPGMNYWRSVGKWEGEVKAFKQHTVCRALCTHLSKLSREDEWGDGCIGFTTMFESFSELTLGEKLDKFKTIRSLMAKVMLNKRKYGRIRGYEKIK